MGFFGTTTLCWHYHNPSLARTQDGWPFLCILLLLLYLYFVFNYIKKYIIQIYYYMLGSRSALARPWPSPVGPGSGPAEGGPARRQCKIIWTKCDWWSGPPLIIAVTLRRASEEICKKALKLWLSD